MAHPIIICSIQSNSCLATCQQSFWHPRPFGLSYKSISFDDPGQLKAMKKVNMQSSFAQARATQQFVNTTLARQCFDLKAVDFLHSPQLPRRIKSITPQSQKAAAKSEVGFVCTRPLYLLPGRLQLEQWDTRHSGHPQKYIAIGQLHPAHSPPWTGVTDSVTCL